MKLCPGSRVISGSLTVAHRWFVFVVVLISGSVPAIVGAQSTPPSAPYGIRWGDEIYLVNTRPVGCACAAEKLLAGVRVSQYAPQDSCGRRCWHSADLASMVSGDPSVTTVFYVHGNQVDPGEDKQEGLLMYRRMVRCAPEGPPIRFVIFSWPSSEVPGPVRDARIKAARTRPVACQFAWLLNQFPPENRLGLIGYSFGARVITGGLHLLAGGHLNGLRLTDAAEPTPRNISVALLAAALDAHWLGAGQYHGLALTQVDGMLLLNSRRDMVMQLYHWSNPCGKPQALGLAGPTCLGPEASLVRKRDVSCASGSKHALSAYLSAPGAARQVWERVTEGS